MTRRSAPATWRAASERRTRRQQQRSSRRRRWPRAAGRRKSAAELYEAAARLTPAANPDDAARRLVGAATALSVAGDLHGAESLARDALGRARTGSIRARALLLLGSLATYTETTAVRVDYQERALLEAGDDAPLRIEILVALFEQIALDPRMAERRADEAIDLLRQGTELSAWPRP